MNYYCVWFPLILDMWAWCLSETLELYLTLHPFKGNHEVMWLQRDLNKSGKIPQVISVWRTQFENGQKSVMHIEKLYEFQTSSLTAPPAWQPAAPPPSSSAPSAFSPPSSSWQWPLTSAYPAQLPRPCGPTAWPPPQQSGPSLPAGLPSPQIAAGE